MMAPRLSRRGVLKAAGLATAAAPLTAACSSNSNTVEVFVNWSGNEYNSFVEVKKLFELQHKPYKVRVVSVGEQMRELLRARFNANNPPDVAVTSLPGLVMEYAPRRVSKLDVPVRSKIPESLNRIVMINDDLYGLWVKAAHKSIFWYRVSALKEFGDGTFPSDWYSFVELLKAGASMGWPMLSIGAADGWVLTDWFENVLAAIDPSTYGALARGDDVEDWRSSEVEETLEKLAEVWTIEGVFPHGPQRALLTQYAESVYEVFAERPSAERRPAIVFEGDFVGEILAGLKGEGRMREEDDDFHRFPTIKVEPLVVGGDVAALLNPSPGGKALVQWLSNPDSMASWITKGGFLSPNTDILPERYQGKHAQLLATQFRDATQPLFDLSDQLGGRLSSGQGRGLQRILTEFFREVTQPGGSKEEAIGTAVKTAQNRLWAAARGNAK